MNLQIMRDLVLAGGPTPAEYPTLTCLLEMLSGLPTDRLASTVTELRRILAPTLVQDSMQGFAYLKPHGYGGDFEMIDRIYQTWLSPDPKLKRWDEFFHAQQAPIAVRNRKQYFIDCLTRLTGERCRILNVASGPGRDVLECLQVLPETYLVTCVDIDPDAINYARTLCTAYERRLTFVQGNALRFQSSDRYDIIWSGGLFDYFDDRLFVIALKRLLKFLSPGGECIIGNFSASNPSIPYMQIVGDWHLYHRDSEKLTSLAIQAGVPSRAIEVKSESLGVNLFLHIGSKGD